MNAQASSQDSFTDLRRLKGRRNAITIFARHGSFVPKSRASKGHKNSLSNVCAQENSSQPLESHAFFPAPSNQMGKDGGYKHRWISEGSPGNQPLCPVTIPFKTSRALDVVPAPQGGQVTITPSAVQDGESCCHLSTSPFFVD